MRVPFNQRKRDNTDSGGGVKRSGVFFSPPAVTGRIRAGFAAAGALKGAENGRIAENLPVEIGTTTLAAGKTVLAVK